MEQKVYRGRVNQLHEQVFNRIGCADKKKLDFDLLRHAIDQRWHLRNYGQGGGKSIDEKAKIRLDCFAVNIVAERKQTYS